MVVIACEGPMTVANATTTLTVGSAVSAVTRKDSSQLPPPHCSMVAVRYRRRVVSASFESGNDVPQSNLRARTSQAWGWDQ